MFRLSLPLLLTLAGAAAQPPGFHLLKTHQPTAGKKVIIRTLSESPNAKITVAKGRHTRTGTLSVTSRETLEKSVTGSGPAAKVTYRTLADLRTTVTTFGQAEEIAKTPGPLIGQSVSGMRDQTGRWKFYPEKNTNDPLVVAAITELEAYENRRIFPDRPVKAGDTWTIDPGFIRHILERDLGKAPLEAAMTFGSVETIGGEPTAILSFSISSTAARENPDIRSGTAAKVSLTGVMHVSLTTMLDKKTSIRGTLVSIAADGDTSTTVTLPVNMTAVKQIVETRTKTGG